MRLIAMLVGLALPVAADDTVRVRECKMPDCILIMPEDLAKLMVTNEKLADELGKAKKELEMLRMSKGCAKLEVIPQRRT